LAKLIAQGASAKMISESPMISPALWTTYATGLPRKAHKIDNFTFKPVWSYEPQAMDSRVRAAPAVWEILSHYKKRVAVINWNAASPAEPINGVFIADGANQNNLSAETVYPPEWTERLKKMTAPRVEWFENNFSRWNHALPAKAYAEDIFVTGAAVEILKSERPDLVMVYFRNVDVVSHLFWKFCFPESPEHKFEVSAQDRERLGDIIPAYYQLTDELVGKILSEANGYDVLVISDHGQGPSYQPKNIFLEINKLLHQLDNIDGHAVLEFKADTCADVLNKMARDGFYYSGSLAKDIFFDCESMQQSRLADARAAADFLVSKQRLGADKLARANPELEELFSTLSHPELAGNIDFKASSLYNLDDFHKDERGIYLNLKARDPEGAIELKDFQAFGNSAIRALSDLQNENGVKLFKTIRPNPDKKKPAVSGPIDPPDILVQFNPAVLTGQSILRSKRDKNPIFISSVLWSYADVSGDHVPEGVWIISRPDARAISGMDMHIYDIAPTVLWWFQAPIGLDMPGKVWSEGFADSKMPIKYVESYAGKIKIPVKYEQKNLSEEERQRLRAIGYIK
jgi:predicted AlkP superfamily phosphohydrolase/phosphomutase